MPHVAVLLSTYNGARWLPEQLASLRAQSHRDWMLYWRDDGSSDDSRAQVRQFGGPAVEGPEGRLRATGSFLALLRLALAGPADYFAFADQDDVWLPDKLAHGVAALAASVDRPALYFCARMLVDAELRPFGRIDAPQPVPPFPAALTQNLAPGCCMMLNRKAAELVDRLPVPEGTWHDWWAYLVVSAYEGTLIAGQDADILYRQHAGNLVGEPAGFWHRFRAAIRRGQGPFMTTFFRHVAVLQSDSARLPARTRAILDQIEAARTGGALKRLRVLFTPGFVRQTWSETALFQLWFLLG